MAEEQETSNFKDGEDGERTYASAVNDLMDVREKAALTPPENTKVNDDGEFEGGEAPGEGTIAKDPKVEEVREKQESEEDNG